VHICVDANVRSYHLLVIRTSNRDMARANAPPEISDFEKQRLANIAERDALLKKLTLEAQQAGLYQKPPSKAAVNGSGASHKKKTLVKRVKREEDPGPRRTSSRLAGIQADSEVAKRRADQEYEAAKEQERAKRQRVSGDLALGDIVVNGRLDGTSLLGTDAILKGVVRPYERTFGEDEIKQTTDKELKSLREQMSGLKLWDAWEPTRIKITPERVYSMSFHPTTTKPLVFAGDKLGNLGIVDGAQQGPRQVREAEEEKSKKAPKFEPASSDGEELDDEADDPDPIITTFKPHTRTISAMHTHPSKPESLYTASYDSSIRAIDLEKQVATEIYGPGAQDDEPISGVDMSASDPQVIYFTTLNGSFGRHDIRQDASSAEVFQLSEKKIGGFSLHPHAPHYVATASLDRFMRLWDLRKVTKKLPTLVGEHESRLSVSHAAFNSAGQVATTSYDDSIKIYSFGVSQSTKGGTQTRESMGHWKAGFQLDDEAMKPEVVVRHNCQVSSPASAASQLKLIGCHPDWQVGYDVSDSETCPPGRCDPGVTES
jgi:WD40 repeat protein